MAQFAEAMPSTNANGRRRIGPRADGQSQANFLVQSLHAERNARAKHHSVILDLTRAQGNGRLRSRPCLYHVLADHETPVGRTLPSTGTTGPVGVSVGLKTLQHSGIKSRTPSEAGLEDTGQVVSTPHGQFGSLGHGPADLLGRVTPINPIGSQIIGARRERTEASEVSLGQINFGLNLM